MPSPERGGQQAEGETEPQPPGYYRAARFRSEQLAGRAYFRVQHVVYDSSWDLSVFRFQLQQVYHVALIGLQPPEELGRRIDAVLAGGEETSLQDNILKLLHDRRAEATKLGPWVEGHYRPGRHV